jgi:hypothetical protein
MGGRTSFNLGQAGAAGVLGVGLVASVWQLWTLPVLASLALALALISPRFRPNRTTLWFLAVGALVLPLTSLAHNKDLDHFYGLTLFLLLGMAGAFLGLNSSPNSIGIGIVVFLLVVIGLSAWTVVTDPLTAFNQTPYHFGALTGPFDHRNRLGAFLGLGMVPLLLLRTRRVWVDNCRLVLAGIASALLIASQSLTPVVALAVTVVLLSVGLSRATPTRLRGRQTSYSRFLAVASGLFLLVGSAVVAVFWVSKLRPSLGSRVDIWVLVIQKLAEEFPFPPDARWIRSGELVEKLGFSPGHAHNALLSLFLIYGVLPSLVFLVAVFGSIVVARDIRPPFWAGQPRESVVVTGLLIFMLLHSLVESTFLAGPVGALICGTAGGWAVATNKNEILPSRFELSLADRAKRHLPH